MLSEINRYSGFNVRQTATSTDNETSISRIRCWLSCIRYICLQRRHFSKFTGNIQRTVWMVHTTSSSYRPYFYSTNLVSYFNNRTGSVNFIERERCDFKLRINLSVVKKNAPTATQWIKQSVGQWFRSWLS